MKVNLEWANLRWANLEGANFEGVDLEGANFKEVHYLTFEQLSKAKTLQGAELDEELFLQLKKDHILFKETSERTDSNKLYNLAHYFRLLSDDLCIVFFVGKSLYLCRC
jgi:uncharacterized protein YjbI with pentapeptide repeats